MGGGQMMTEEHSQPEHEKDADALSPAVQRRLWRRAWLVMGLCIFSMPVVLWIVIDQAGKAEWRDVQERLRAKGEATTIEDLNLPTRDEVPDEENFCAIPWLIANDDGTDSLAVEQLRSVLRLFGGSPEEPDLLGDVWGKAMLGYRGDVSALARLLELNATEGGNTLPASILQEAEDDPLLLSRAYLNLAEDYAKTAEAARKKPLARFLPLYEQRLALASGSTFHIRIPSLSTSQDLCKYLVIRALVATRSGDFETSLRSLEVAQRLGEAVANEQCWIAGLVAVTQFSVMLQPIAECLWDGSFINDASRLLQLQLTLEAWDLNEVLAQSLRGEVVFFNEGMRWFSRHPAEAPNTFDGSLGGLAIGPWATLIPSGWWIANAAFNAELSDRTLLEACRNGSHADLVSGAERLETEIDSLTPIKSFYRAIVAVQGHPFSSIIRRFSHAEARRRQAIVVCALYRYRLDKEGKFPTTLDELVPSYLDSVPADPIDGKPIRYVSMPDVSGSFVLYSIGNDETDDDGVLNLDPDEPRRTRIEKSSYVGDWPWPVEPRERPASGSEER